MPPKTAPAITEPQTANDATCLISAGLRGVVLRRAEQPRDERAAADAEHAADGHDQAEQRCAERDRGEQRGVVQRADEARVDEVVDGADDHRGGHRHAEVHEGADDRRGREVPAVGADGVGLRRAFEVRGGHGCSFRCAGWSARRRTPVRRGCSGCAAGPRGTAQDRVGCGSSAVIFVSRACRVARSASSSGARIVSSAAAMAVSNPAMSSAPCRRRVDAFAALVARLGAALDEAAALEPLQQARDARGARAGHLGDVALDRTGVLDEIAEREALLEAELAGADPVLGRPCAEPT